VLAAWLLSGATAVYIAGAGYTMAVGAPPWHLIGPRSASATPSPDAEPNTQPEPRWGWRDGVWVDLSEPVPAQPVAPHRPADKPEPSPPTDANARTNPAAAAPTGTPNTQAPDARASGGHAPGDGFGLLAATEEPTLDPSPSVRDVAVDPDAEAKSRAVLLEAAMHASPEATAAVTEMKRLLRVTLKGGGTAAIFGRMDALRDEAARALADANANGVLDTRDELELGVDIWLALEPDSTERAGRRLAPSVALLADELNPVPQQDRRASDEEIERMSRIVTQRRWQLLGEHELAREADDNQDGTVTPVERALLFERVMSERSTRVTVLWSDIDDGDGAMSPGEFARLMLVSGGLRAELVLPGVVPAALAPKNGGGVVPPVLFGDHNADGLEDEQDAEIERGLTPAQQAYTRTARRLARAEALRLSTLDLDGDGHVSAFEARLGGERLADETARDATLRDFDTDDDGTITEAELVRYRRFYDSRSPLADIDRDGEITSMDLIRVSEIARGG